MDHSDLFLTLSQSKNVGYPHTLRISCSKTRIEILESIALEWQDPSAPFLGLDRLKRDDFGSFGCNL
jgi:hypothetical protein